MNPSADLRQATTFGLTPGRLAWSLRPYVIMPGPASRLFDGSLEVVRRDIPPEVEWRCPVCGDGGVVSGWSATVLDLSRRGTPRRLGLLHG